MLVNEIRDFNFENYYKRIWFPKENSYYSKKRLKKNIDFCCNRLIEKIPGPRNAKEHYQPFMRNKNTKWVKKKKKNQK